MKKQSILNLNISSINDITKIEESCKYIDLDLTNYSSEVINYFLKIFSFSKLFLCSILHNLLSYLLFIKLLTYNFGTILAILIISSILSNNLSL